MASESRAVMPTSAQLYIAAVIAGGCALSLFFAFSGGIGWPHPEVGAFEIVSAATFFAVVAFLSEMYPIELPSTNMFEQGGDELVVSSAAYVACLLLFGPALTIVVAIVAAAGSDLCHRKPLYKVAFNVGQYVLTIGIAGFFLLNAGNTPHSFAPLLEVPGGILALLGTLFGYFFLNSTLVATVVAMSDGIGITDIWKQANAQSLAQYAGMLTIGVVAAILWTISPLALILLALPILVVHLALKAHSQLKRETIHALVVVAEMVDARDSYAYHHSRDVARYAARVATAMELPIEAVETIKMAAQLHDIGKIGTPDRILHKPGPLTPEERQQMEMHSTAGAEVLSYFSLFRAGADLALHHHEHYDGTGYPAGLAGERIPLGARIIHVVDSYQAMTSDRVYRQALTSDEAVRRLLAGAGQQFDPEVLRVFIGILRESGAASPEAAVTDEGVAVPLVAGRS